MQGKTMYRLLGFLVVVSLVIILMPFFQTQKQLTSEAALMKVPPFPDQPAQIAANEPATISPVQPLPSQGGVNQQPDEVINPARPVAVQNTPTYEAAPIIASSSASNQPTELAPIPTVQDSGEQKVVAQMKDEEVTPPSEIVKIKKAVVTSIHTVSSKHSTKLAQTKSLKNKIVQHKPAAKPFVQPASNDSNGLINLKNQVWVIQVGSYKNKTTALRVVNRLRASGYRAFIQAAVDDTRVFIGPENKRATAHSVATRLQNEMNLHGIVISYQPLAL